MRKLNSAASNQGSFMVLWSVSNMTVKILTPAEMNPYCVFGLYLLFYVSFAVLLVSLHEH